MSKRKEDLIEYLDVLLQVNRYGIGCDDKIVVALNELHKEMGFGSGDIYNIAINQHISDNSKEVVNKIMKHLKRTEEENTLSWSKATDSITSTSDGDIKVAGTITGSKISLGEGFEKVTKEEEEKKGNPFDTIE